MADLEYTVANIISPYCDRRMAIGVSGGRDSMCLLNAVIGCGAVSRDKITVVHVNHGLREQADGDERFVRDFCQKNSIDFRAFRIDVKRESALKGQSIEQAARNLRYAVFFDLIKSRAVSVILTAHHALDNAESVLMHMFRGSGMDGLCGMSSARFATKNTSCDYASDLHGMRLPLLRPFIDVYPEEIEEYRISRGIPFVVDETNNEDSADRNFIRLNVIPLIEQRYRGAVRAINELSRECAGACEFMDGMLDMTHIRESDGAMIIDDAALKDPLAARYVRSALQFFSLTDVTRAQIERVIALVKARTGAEVELNNSVKAAREYGCVALYLPRPTCSEEKPLTFGANFIDGLAVDVKHSDADPRSIRGCAADGDALRGATLRFRRDGDIFTPLGGKRKKLKQYFIDKKIPKRLRDRLPLVCRANTVLMVVGVEVSEQAKQTDATKEKVAVIPRR